MKAISAKLWLRCHFVFPYSNKEIKWPIKVRNGIPTVWFLKHVRKYLVS